ncbi:MAG: DUF4290 domain-containing protein [Chitinophagaceae bacterium]|nr:DUF4290 domain-containing protein [Chitinophagaceae bacterium]
MEYNTTRNHLMMKEYGRHIQKMIEYITTIEDPEVRQSNAYSIIELMGFLNPHLKNVEDFRHKLWDHLFLVSDFKLEVESPYPIPTKETLKAGPMELKYPKRYPRFSHMGKNLELVIQKALKEENPEKRNGFANSIAYYMKLAYTNWHKEAVHDDAIQSELAVLTEGQLEFTNTPFVKSYRPNETRERERGTGYDYRNNKRNPKFQARSGNGGGNSRGNDLRDQRGNGGNDMRDNRGGGMGGNNNNRSNNKFNKKRFK